MNIVFNFKTLGVSIKHFMNLVENWTQKTHTQIVVKSINLSERSV